jgi:hypothetical protein
VDTQCVSLQNWAVPQWFQYQICGLFSEAFEKIFNKFNVSPIWEDRRKLLFSRLEHTESGVDRAINDLDVVHGERSTTKGICSNLV